MKKIVKTFAIVIIMLFVLTTLNYAAIRQVLDIKAEVDSSKIENKKVLVNLSLTTFADDFDTSQPLALSGNLVYSTDIFKSVTIQGKNGWSASLSNNKFLLDSATTNEDDIIATITFTIDDDVDEETTDIILNGIDITNGDDIDYSDLSLTLENVKLKKTPVTPDTNNTDDEEPTGNNNTNNNSNDNEDEDNNDNNNSNNNDNNNNNNQNQDNDNEENNNNNNSSNNQNTNQDDEEGNGNGNGSNLDNEDEEQNNNGNNNRPSAVDEMDFDLSYEGTTTTTDDNSGTNSNNDNKTNSNEKIENVGDLTTANGKTIPQTGDLPIGTIVIILLFVFGVFAFIRYKSIEIKAK